MPPTQKLVLDPHQEALAQWRNGIAVSASAAGSGKSTCLVERTSRLISENYDPQRICVLMYNTDAADSFRRKLQLRVGYPGTRVVASTFHSWGYALLRHWYPREERLRPKRILTAEGGEVRPGDLVYPLIKKLKLSTDMDTALSYAALMAECLLDFSDPLALPSMDQVKKLIPGVPKSALPRWMQFFVELEKSKRAHRVIDFADMLFQVAKQILLHPTAAHICALGGLYRHVMVDEAQDLNPARVVIAKLLMSAAQSGLYVGDPNQAIYGFGGADPDTLLNLVNEGATLLRLPVNRRSTPEIVETGNQIVRGCQWNLTGDCQALEGTPQGTPVLILETPTPESEAKEAANWAKWSLDQGLSIAILARTNAWLIPIEAACIAAGMHVTTLGQAQGVWGSTFGEDLYAYLSAAEGINPGKALYRILNKPKRFAKGEQLLQEMKAVKSGDFVQALMASEHARIANFGYALYGLRGLSWPRRVEQSVSYLVSSLQEDSSDNDEVQNVDKVEAYQYLGKQATDLGSLQAIDEYKRSMTATKVAQTVILSSIHKSKGLEFDVVFVAGVNTRRLPHEKSTDEGEERRIFYVAATRPKQRLILSPGGKPSPFLELLSSTRSPEEGFDDSESK